MRGRDLLDLNPGTLERLRNLQRTSKDVRVHRRATVLVCLAQGCSVQETASINSITDRAVRKIRSRWNRSGFQGLKDLPRSGRPPKADEKYRRLLVRTVQTCPLQMGYVFSVWSTARLAEHMRVKTGVSLGPARIGKILRQEGFTFGRPAHSLKGKRDEQEHRKAKKQLKKLKKGLSEEMLDSVFSSPTSLPFIFIRT